MHFTFRTFILFSVLLTGPMRCLAQDEDVDKEDMPVAYKKARIFTGMYLGSYFANKYSASAYNGYGFDVEGNRNTFANSFMHQKIINEYGGGYGQFDYVAQALGVDQKQWEFNESDMPVNMHYLPAIMVGFNFKIPLRKKTALILNINSTKLSIEGNFTITTLRPPGTNPSTNTNLKVFPIRGTEQRVLFQAGIQHLLGKDDKFNFFVEGGVNGTLAKFDKNTIYINNLQIDLTSYVNQTLYPSPGPTKRPVGFGLGAFGGFGTNFELNRSFTLQFLYSLSHERIKIGTNPAAKIQHALGLRIYYKI